MGFSTASAPYLKVERIRHGLNRKQAAELAGITCWSWGCYERGSVVPGGDVLWSLAKAGWNVQAILQGEPAYLHRYSLSADEQLVLEAYRAIPAPQKAPLLAELLRRQHD